MSNLRHPHALLIALTSMIALSLPHAAPASDSMRWSVPPFEASYAVKIGVARANTTITLTALEDGRYAVTSTTQAKGVARWFKKGEVYERTVFRFVDGDVLAESLERRDTLSPIDRNVSITYSPDEGTAVVVYDGETSTARIPRNASNPLLMQITLMHAMATAQVPTHYDVLDYAGMQRFDVRVGTEATVRTTDGKRTAIPTDLSNVAEQTSTRIWATQDSDWLALVVEARKEDDIKAVLRLTEITRP
ncbi:MAG: DUF3108 domain-containing protein [Pseudomonadota bacterium]